MTSFPLFYELNDIVSDDPSMARVADRVARLAMNARMIYALSHRIPLAETTADMVFCDGELTITARMRHADG